uniref:Uncharacterized protein n=1 Tax=Sphaerodactylus townsendi TaxID=933632 RepID=A0ACB8FQG1_9SAUR
MSSPSNRPMEVSAASPTVGRVYPPRSPKSVSAVPVSSQDSPMGSTVPAAPASPSESRTALEPSASPTPPSPKVLTSAPIAAVEVKEIHMSPAVQAPQMYPYHVSNSVTGQQGKYRAKGSLPQQRSDQHQPTSAPPIMQAAAAAGPPLVAATPYSSYISYNPQQFTGQPTMMQPMAHYSSQPVFAPMLHSNPRMMTSGSHPHPKCTVYCLSKM